MAADRTEPGRDEERSAIGNIIRFCLEQKLVVALLTIAVIGAGVVTAPFDWQIAGIERSPVAVDAIPDIGENQQIVFTDWPGRSPQDVQDQVTYPLTTALLGVPGVKTIRSTSMFGFSSIFVIFEEDREFYWARTRILEKLNSLPPGLLPEDVQPALGPDATALGQVFWYTLEARDPQGRPVGGWDPHELRSIQDWTVRYGLLTASGVSEVASIGGFVREYQIDVNPDAMRAHAVTLEQVFQAVRKSNLDVGARTIEVNRVEYVLRGLGFVRELADLEEAVVRVSDGNVPIRVRDVAHVTIGPAERRGALDQEGAEAVGGIVTVRYGHNPLEAIQSVKRQIEVLAPGLPAKALIDWRTATREQVETFARAQGFTAFAADGITPEHEAWVRWLRATPAAEWPAWVNLSQIHVVPFYDRTGLIYETLGTLNKAIFEQILITIIVVVVMLMHLRSSLLISAMLPLAVLGSFIAMRFFGVDANVVALSGIAIAIGTIVDMGIILSENILRHLKDADPRESRLRVVHRASTEVGSAVLTAVATTVISFLPVFTMVGPEGKLFRPLAFTKTFALIASIVIALTILPAAAQLLLAGRRRAARASPRVALAVMLATGGALFLAGALVGGAEARWVSILLWVAGAVVLGVAGWRSVAPRIPALAKRRLSWVVNGIAVLAVAWLLARSWMPIGLERGLAKNFLFVALLVGGLLGAFLLFYLAYGRILRWCVEHKLVFFALPVSLLVLGGTAWLGFERVFGFIPAAVGAVGVDPQRVRLSEPWVWAKHEFPPLGREFMPTLDEGSFLFMPTVTPHASIGEALEIMQAQDLAMSAVPEVETVVGKLGRAESPLDPAPVSMFETLIVYKPEYVSDARGYPIRYRYDAAREEFVRDASGALVPDPRGRPFRQWRDHVRNTDDIWREIEQAARMPGVTGASKAGPIAIRQVMLQSGITSPTAVRVSGPDLEAIEQAALRIEEVLRQGTPGISGESVRALRSLGKPYLLIEPDRRAIARYGLNIQDVQDVIEVALGGRPLTMTVEGRERYAVRVRYPRELRGSAEEIERILVPAMTTGQQVPLGELATVRYEPGPQEIRTEGSFLVNYVLFGAAAGVPEVDAVEQVDRFLRQEIARGGLVLPAGVSFSFVGTYENQLRAQKTLMIVLPVALFAIFLILYLNFRSVTTSTIIFAGIAVAWAGGFVMIWFYGQPWFGDFSLFGVNMRDTFQLQAINLSVAVWVGFLALFGIATDDGVLIATYLDQSFASRKPRTIAEIRSATIEGGIRRARPALMTTATTILALLPVLTSTGRGSDIMVPMAIPTIGGMTLAILTMFTVPVLYCWVAELRLKGSAGAETDEMEPQRAA